MLNIYNEQFLMSCETMKDLRYSYGGSFKSIYLATIYSQPSTAW